MNSNTKQVQLCCVSAYSDVEDRDHVEGTGEDGAHAFDGRLIQTVVGRQHLPVRDKQITTTQCAC